MRHLPLLLGIVCFSIKTYSYSPDKEIFKIDLLKKVYSKNYLDLPDETKSIIAPSIMPGGDFIYSKSVSCTFALSDVNGNGIFNEIGIDNIIIGVDDSSMYIHPSVQAREIAPVTYILIGNTTFKVEDIDPKGTYLILSHCNYCNGSKDIKPTLKLFNKLPDISFENITGNKTDFSSFKNKGKYIYVEFWATWCHPCVEAIPELKELHGKYSNQAFFISLNYKDNDKDEIKKFVMKNNIPWENGFANKLISEEFLQNGFPYGVLFDEKGNILEMDLHPTDLRNILEKYISDSR